MADLDLTTFLKDASVANLDWLEVDESEYRKQDHLPKQNLDIQPDLEAFWAREGESPTTYLIPNVVPVPTMGISNPKTMGDMSQEHGRLRGQAEEIAKVARLALMQSNDLTRFKESLAKRYPLDTLREYRDVLASVLDERGLVGRYYIVAEDFSGVDKAKAEAFISKYASTAQYTLSKEACSGCSHCQTAQANDPGHCSQFHRELVTEVPYTARLASLVEKAQAARGRSIQASTGMEPKERIRRAYLASDSTIVASGQTYVGQGTNHQPKIQIAPEVAQEKLVQATSLLRKKQAEDKVALEARSVLNFLHREMSGGLSHEELVASMKLAFDNSLLVRTNQYWRPLLKQAGLGLTPGQAGKPLTFATVEAVLTEHRIAGRLPQWDNRTASSWGDTPTAALRAIYNEVRKAPQIQTAAPRMGMMSGFHGNTVNHKTSGLTRREIIKKASQFMNEGLYGNDLMEALTASFETRDLIASKAELKTVLAEQGLQGIYYVDPTAYDDYGKGCNEASRLHGTRLVEYVKTGSKCGSCVHQVKNGYCSKLNKKLAHEPPYVDKYAQQREILASGNSTEISYASLVNNGASMIDEFQMQNEMQVDVKAAEVVRDVTLMFGTGKIKL
jgi:hypothetical protein